VAVVTIAGDLRGGIVEAKGDPGRLQRRVYIITHPRHDDRNLQSPLTLITSFKAMTSSKFVTSEDGTKIWTDVAGDPSKPSIVFIPGASSSSLVFDRQFQDPELTKDFRLVRYDVRGQGLSDQPLDPSAWTSNRFAEDFKAVVEAHGLKKPFIAAWSAGGSIVVDITTYLGPDSYSGVIFLGSIPFRSWNAEITNPWLVEMVPRIISSELSDLCSTARDFVEALTFHPDKLHPITKLAWIGAYASQHPVARMSYISRTQDEGALKSAVGKVPVLALLGKDDKFLLVDPVEKLYKETFADVEVQIWPEVGHLPFFEEPEKTRNAISAFVKRVTKA